MREYGLEPQVILTTPLLEGTDGVEKMSKSLGNYIGFTERPEDIFGKVMSISDRLMFRYWELLTDLPAAEISRLKEETASGKVHPMEIKGDLALASWRTFMAGTPRWRRGAFCARSPAGRSAGGDGGDQDPHRRRRAWPRDTADVSVRPAMPYVVDILVDSGMAPSKIEARRLMKAGAVTIDGEKVDDARASIPAGKGSFVLRCGKLRFRRVVAVFSKQ